MAGLDESQRWYTRAMVIRGMVALEQDIEAANEMLDKEEIPGSIRASLKGMKAYNEQLLDEARQFVPGELQKEKF